MGGDKDGQENEDGEGGGGETNDGVEGRFRKRGSCPRRKCDLRSRPWLPLLSKKFVYLVLFLFLFYFWVLICGLMS